MCYSKCSICGNPISNLEGRGSVAGHTFHISCENGAINYMALIKELGGDSEPRRMMFWPNARKAGVKKLFPKDS